MMSEMDVEDAVQYEREKAERSTEDAYMNEGRDEVLHSHVTVVDYNIHRTNTISYFPIEPFALPDDFTDDLITMTSNQNRRKRKKYKRIMKGAALALLATLLLYIVLDYNLEGLGYFQRAMVDFLDWVNGHPVEGIFAFAAVYILITLPGFPGAGIALTISSGVLFGQAFGEGMGILLATTSVFIGGSIGGIMCFKIGRLLLREKAQKLFNRYKLLKAIDMAIEKEGLKLIFLLRLSPVVPWATFNYLLGVTRVRTKDFVVGCLGLIPITAAQAYLGISAASLGSCPNGCEGRGGALEGVKVGVSLAATLAAVALLTVASRRALRRMLDGEEGKGEGAARSCSRGSVRVSSAPTEPPSAASDDGGSDVGGAAPVRQSLDDLDLSGRRGGLRSLSQEGEVEMARWLSQEEREAGLC